MQKMIEPNYNRPCRTFTYYEKHCPLLHSLEYPLDMLQAYSLEQQYGYDICRDYLAQLNNYRGAKKYLSVFSTLEMWIRKDLRNDTKLIEAHNRYLDSKRPKPEAPKKGNLLNGLITCDMYEKAKAEFLETHPAGTEITVEGLGTCFIRKNGAFVDVPDTEEPILVPEFIDKYFPAYIYKQAIK